MPSSDPKRESGAHHHRRRALRQTDVSKPGHSIPQVNLVSVTTFLRLNFHLRINPYAMHAGPAWRVLRLVEGAFMKELFSGFLKDQSGATAIEYGLIAGLIAVVIIGAVGAVGTNLTTKFNAVAAALS
jgi:pilus assembly protein Flp/PilA